MFAPMSVQTQTRLAALRDELGVERLVLSLHQLSFPAGEDDIGIGTPYTSRARDVLAWAKDLGFTGVALGPGGITSRANPSPYDASLFSLNPAFVAYGPLVERGLLAAPERAAVPVTQADRTHHVHAWETARDIVRQVRARLRTDPALAREASEVDALARDPLVAREAAFEGAAGASGTDDWRTWTTDRQSEAAQDAFVVGQWLVRAQHRTFRAWARALDLAVYGDAQVGVSHRDVYMHRGLFLDDYRMGAPPSRTNPEGQPWSYPVLDPAQPERVVRFLEERFAWLLSLHDGVRLDHPHGWVCPWVYRADDPDPLHAVKNGARLFESPSPSPAGLVDHPALAKFARVRADQLDPSRPRHDDHWVTRLEPEQVEAYASQVLLLLARAHDAGVDARDVMCEVLSTCPLPLRAVLERCGLGRFRVTQKARVDVDGDVYRSDSAQPHDWIMAGNHDTPPLRAIVKRWMGTDEARKRAEYLSRRLKVSADELARDVRAMQEAMLADCFIGPARRVIIFWADLFGEERIYNRPGEVHDDNWTLRMPADFERAHAQALAEGTAPRLDRITDMALAARR